MCSISNQYYNDLGKLSMLTQDEQSALVREAKAGDRKSFNKLVEGNLRLVVFHAKKYESYLPINSAITIDDLISEGNIGLIKAINKYELGHNTHLSYFAGVAIKRAIIDLLIANAETIKIPYKKFRSLTKISNTINEMLQTTGEINYNDLERLYSESEIEFYNNRPVKTEINESDNYFRESNENESELLERLELLLKTLTLREAKIIREYYGINAPKKTLTLIAKELGISKARVSNVHKLILIRFRVI